MKIPIEQVDFDYERMAECLHRLNMNYISLDGFLGRLCLDPCHVTKDFVFLDWYGHLLAELRLRSREVNVEIVE